MRTGDLVAKHGCVLVSTPPHLILQGEVLRKSLEIIKQVLKMISKARLYSIVAKLRRGHAGIVSSPFYPSFVHNVTHNDL